jgi:hypothetical protein
MSRIKDAVWEQIEEGKETEEITLNERNQKIKS